MAAGTEIGNELHILLVDDHAIVIDGIAALLSDIPGMHIAGKAANGVEALALLAESRVDIVITDYSMDGMDGLTLVRNIKKLYPATKIIVLSMHDEPTIIQDTLRAGVDGYILKKYTSNELRTAIEIIMAGGQFWSPEINKILLQKLQPDNGAHLTDRELEVLKLLINELNSREIAEKLFISERTVETHRKNLMRKTNAANIVGLIKYATSHGLA